MPEDHATEGRVKALLEGGDARSAASLVMHEYGPSILRFLRSVLRDEAAVGDAYSDFAESMWKGLPRFRGEASLKTWSLRIALHAVTHMKNEAWNRRGRRFETGEMSLIAEEIRTKTALRIERQRSALDELRRELSVEDQSLMALRIDQELSWEEIATVLEESGAKVSTAALWKRFERLKRRLAELARERGMLD